ncbi:MAG: hypothetical protein CMC38_04935 [Flavobacteriaceae bacterium]|nr:hypothetical protein [Flavobacteriaceae bacterium]
MSINDLDSFKKVMIENSYEIAYDDTMTTGDIIYAYNPTRKFSEVFGEKIDSAKWGSYSKDDSWLFQFSDQKTLIDKFSNYDVIIKNIKSECKYVNIKKYKDIEFVTYNCQESKFDGTIGFAVDGGTAFIVYFPSEMQVLR